MATLHEMAMKYADKNISGNPQLTYVDKEQYISYIDGAGDALYTVLDKIKAKYGYDKPFLYIDLLDTVNELFKEKQS